MKDETEIRNMNGMEKNWQVVFTKFFSVDSYSFSVVNVKNGHRKPRIFYSLKYSGWGKKIRRKVFSRNLSETIFSPFKHKQRHLLTRILKTQKFYRLILLIINAIYRPESVIMFGKSKESLFSFEKKQLTKNQTKKLM